MRKDSGLTIVELVLAICVIGILGSISAPNVSRWLQNSRLKRAARDLNSNMQLAKLGAIKSNTTWAIVFDTTVTPGRYFLCSDDGDDGWDGPSAMGGNDTSRKEGLFGAYGRGIDYGHGPATAIGGGACPADNVGYNSNVLVFNSRGMCNAGYVYLENNQGRPASERYAYAVGTRTNGNVVLRKWAGDSSGSWGHAF